MDWVKPPLTQKAVVTFSETLDYEHVCLHEGSTI